MSFPRYEQYKDGGVEWLGEVPEHWEVISFKRVLARPLQYGANEGADQDIPGNPRYIRITDIDSSGGLKEDTFRSLPIDVAEPYLLEDGDLLLARSGATVGKSFVYRATWGLCCFAGYLIRARISPARASASFINFVLQSHYYWQFIGSEQIQSTIQNVSAEKYNSFVVACPPVNEQSDIVAFLDFETSKLDALIEEQRLLIELLKEKRQAVITHTITRGLNSTAPVQFSGADWLGLVPTHWLVERAGHLFLERDERSESGDEEMLTVSHLTGVTPRSEKTVNMFEAETTEGYKKVYPGDLVINTLWAWMGAMGVSSNAGIVSPAYHVYRTRPAMIPGYVNALVRMSAFAKEASRWSKGVWSSRLRLYPQDMFQILFPVPPLDEQEKISARILEQDEEMAALIRESELGITLLLERRTALISAAVTGKIDIRNYSPKEAA